MASIKDFDYSEKLVDFILQGIENNLSSKEMFNEAASMGYKSDSESFRRYINRIKKRFGMIRKEDMVSEVDAKLIKILENKKIIKEEELLSNLKCSRTTLNKSIKDCRRCGYEILQDNGNIFLSTIKVRDSEKVTQLPESFKFTNNISKNPALLARTWPMPCVVFLSGTPTCATRPSPMIRM